MATREPPLDGLDKERDQAAFLQQMPEDVSPLDGLVVARVEKAIMPVLPPRCRKLVERFVVSRPDRHSTYFKKMTYVAGGICVFIEISKRDLTFPDVLCRTV